MTNLLRVIPLGGLGEIGKNMMALEAGEDIIVIDSGVLFPGPDTPGVDLIIPDISYLLENRHKVRGIVITHGHEDHTGALPYVLAQLNVPVYAPRLAQGLIEVKIREHHLHNEVVLESVCPGRAVNLGQFTITWFRVCHSIPDAMGLAIQTPVGLVIHTGDFKIDYTPADGVPTDLGNIAKLAADGVTLLLSDSTYAEVPGYTPSEQLVGEALETVIANANGRVLIATFASLISRIQQVLDVAAKYGRRVGFVGRSMVANVNMALKMGYLSDQEGLIATLKEIRDLAPEKVVIMTTGSQGEPTSALVRIAKREHRDVDIIEGDTVVLSSTPIPGNETVVSKTIDNLLRQGARVLYDKIAMVHVHGHASREELKLILNLTRPTYFVPVHGEHRHLMAHAALAQSLGIARESTFVLDNGDVIEIGDNSARQVDGVKSGRVYVDGLRALDVDDELLDQRKSLSRDGVLVLAVVLDRNTGRLARNPDIVSRGFIEISNRSEILDEISNTTKEAIAHADPDKADNTDFIIDNIKREVGILLRHRVGRRPVILPLVLKV